MKNNLNPNSYYGNEQKTNFMNASILEVSQLVKYFEDELKDLYWAEKTLTKVIPVMIAYTTSMELKKELMTQLVETNQQIERLAQVFISINKYPIAVKCEVMEGLVKEAYDKMKSNEPGTQCDTGIIIAAQKVKSYKIAAYSKIRKIAEKLDLSKAVTLITATLEEEEEAAQKLTEVTVSEFHTEAVNY